jgi:YtkA-like
MLFNVRNAAAAALIALASMTPAPSWAAIQDYEFQLVQGDIKKADSAEIAVRLTDKRTGAPVPNAVIFAQRIDMAPDGMEGMTSTIAPLPSTEPGLYRFKINLPMAGGWRLSLGAKVQGETGTLETKLPFKAVP